MQGKRAGEGQHGKRGGGATQDERVVDDRMKGQGHRTQHKAAVEAMLLGRRFALHGGGHLGRRQVLHGGGNGKWSSYVVANRMQLVTCSSVSGPWDSVPHEKSFLVLFLASGIEHVFYLF